MMLSKSNNQEFEKAIFGQGEYEVLPTGVSKFYT